MRVAAAARRSGPGVVLLGALLVVVAAGALVTRGLDRTDEGLYLNAIADPRSDRSTILLFGYAYHPLFLLLGGDVVLLRWAGIALSVGAVTWLAWVVLGTPALLRHGHLPGRATRVAASAALGATALLPLVQMPSTPSYNTLALQALSLSATGLVLAVTRPSRAGPIGAALVGVGGWLAFLAKPTTALLLACIVVLVAVVAPGRWLRRAWAVAAGLAGAAALTLVLARSAPSDLVTVLGNGLATSNALAGHDNLLRLDPFPLRPFAVLTVVAAAIVAGGLLALGDRLARAAQGRPWRLGLLVGLALGVALTAVALGAVALWSRRGGGFQSAGRDGIAALFAASGIGVVTAATLAALHSRGRGTLRARLAGSRVRLALLGALLLLPPAYAFGTNLNLWTAMGRVSCFWLLVLTVLLARRGRSAWLAPAAAPVTLVAVLLAATAAAPYRYYPLADATVPTPVGSGTVRLTAADHDRVVALQRLAAGLGVTPETRVLDLTGDSPGSIYLIGARPVGQDWILGGYSGSEAAAELALRNDRCSLREALVLTAEQAPRAIPSRVLATVGLDLRRDYAPVGTFDRARTAWGGRPATVDTVTVLRPQHPLAIPGCA